VDKPEKSKRFKYKLETVLKVRKIKEKEEQDKFADATKKLTEEEKKEKEIKDFQSEKYSELRDTISGKDGQHTDIQNVMLRNAHLEVVKEQVIDQEKKKDEAEKAKEEQREKLIKAAQEKQIIEKNKDKNKIAWKKFMDKEESKFMDEIASIKKARQMIEEKED
jgi:flagellar protein FliJ